MKNKITTLLVIIMLFSLAACGKPATPEEVGSYVLYEMVQDGVTTTHDELVEIGVEDMFSLELKADGTGTLKEEEEEQSFTWKDGKMTADGDTISYEYKDGKMTLTDESITLVFQRAEDTSK